MFICHGNAYRCIDLYLDYIVCILDMGGVLTTLMKSDMLYKYKWECLK